MSRELVDAVIRAAMDAPSNLNRQPWRFVVFDTPDESSHLLDALQRAVTEGRRLHDPALDLLVDHLALWADGIAAAPTHILVFTHALSEPIKRPTRLLAPEMAVYDPNTLSTGMAIQNLLLAAHAAGLGACMHANPVPFLRSGINALIGEPSSAELVGWVTVGDPDEVPSRPSRRELDRVRRYAGERT